MKKLLTLAIVVIAAFGFNATPADASWVRGSVIAADDSPVAGAQVMIQNLDRVRGQRQFMARTESAEDGSFGFRGVPDGRYIVTACTRELGAGRAEVNIENGQGVEGVIIRLAGRPGNGGGGNENPATGAISGTVTFNDAGVEGARVVAAPVRINRMRGFVRARLTADTDANGDYTIAEVPVGNWIVMAMKREVGMGRGRAEVVEGETTDVDITLIGRQR